ncbi:MAG TPA: hypothetical protein K8W04_02675 [Bacteroides reticulotermitis]|nr:hypothetical protein [Bacteroides reticulotermitis]
MKQESSAANLYWPNSQHPSTDQPTRVDKTADLGRPLNFNGVYSIELPPKRTIEVLT